MKKTVKFIITPKELYKEIQENISPSKAAGYWSYTY